MALPMCDHHAAAVSLFCCENSFSSSRCPRYLLNLWVFLLSYLCRLLSWVLGSPTNHCMLLDEALKS